jgi:hypothetical protein
METFIRTRVDIVQAVQWTGTISDMPVELHSAIKTTGRTTRFLPSGHRLEAGNWIVKLSNGFWNVMGSREFKNAYSPDRRTV